MKNGFTRVPNKILLSEQLNSCEKLVLCILEMHAMKKRTSFPARSTIARETGFHIQTVDKALNSLLEKRFILKEERKGCSSVFKLNYEKVF